MRDALIAALWVRVAIQPLAKPRNRRRAEVEADAHMGFQGLRDQELNERRKQRFASLADVVGRKPRQRILYAGAEINRLYPGCRISMSHHAV